ncbi:hypothetical protein [Celeribacter arenosi]|uniref:Uncharacterized protein n=1 Tax=Celeribacter arenosi TaxID=792649 RepID=A0ABP7JWZ1_9RHOB
MYKYGAEVSGLTYNPSTRRFEALVIFHEAEDRASYPVALALPIDTDFGKVSRLMIRAAQQLRSDDRGATVSRLVEMASQTNALTGSGHSLH